MGYSRVRHNGGVFLVYNIYGGNHNGDFKTTFNGIQVKSWNDSDLEVGDFVLGLKPNRLSPKIFEGVFGKHILKGAYKYYIPRDLGYLLTDTGEEFENLEPTSVVTLFSDGTGDDVDISYVPYGNRNSSGLRSVEDICIFQDPQFSLEEDDDHKYTVWVVTEQGFEVYLTPSFKWTPSVFEVWVSYAWRRFSKASRGFCDSLLMSVSLVPYFLYSWLRASWFYLMPAILVSVLYWLWYGVPTELEVIKGNLTPDFEYIGASAFLFAVFGLVRSIFSKGFWKGLGKVFKPHHNSDEITYRYDTPYPSRVLGVGISELVTEIDTLGVVTLSSKEMTRLGLPPFVSLVSPYWISMKRKSLLEILNEESISLRAFENGCAYCLDFRKSKIQSQLEDLLVLNASSSSNMRSLREIVNIAFKDYEMFGDSNKLDSTIDVLSEYSGNDEGYIRERLSKIYHGGDK